MLSAILACFLGALLAPALKKLIGKGFQWALAAIPLALFVLILEQAAWLTDTQGSSYALQESYPWFDQWKIFWDFKADGLSMLLAGLVTGVGTFITIYAGSYLKGHKYLHRFFVYLFIFMGAMLGIAFSDNFYAFFLFWELTGISSYFLIAFNFEDSSARKNALQALLVTGIGGLALLASFILIHTTLGVSTFSYLNQHSANIMSSDLFGWIIGLLFLGALTKSAQFPFHFWLPNAMSAPTPASAYLHSATMVKAGVFLLARVLPAFESSPYWFNVLVPIGAITILIAAFMSFFQTDLKKLLAYTTLGALGILVLALGIGTPLMLKSALGFMVAHAFYKASLFLVAGIVDHETGTRDIRKLSQLKKYLPITCLGMTLACIAKIGLPPSLSFITKETMLEAALNAPWGPLWAICIGIGAVSFVFVGIHMVYIFYSNKTPYNAPIAEPHKAPWAMWIAPLALGLIGLALPFMEHILDGHFISPAYDTFLKPSFEYQLSFWHGFSWPLAISVLSIGTGYMLFQYCRSNVDELLPIVENLKYGTSKGYDFFIHAINNYTGPIFRLFQNGSLRFYMQCVLWFFSLSTLFYILVHSEQIPQIPAGQEYPWTIILLQGTIITGALLALRMKRVFTSILALGFVGFGIALIYVHHGAPDLAMTQFLVETLTLILLVVILKKMPASANLLPPSSKIISLSLALLCGVVFALITFISASTQIPNSVSSYYANTSKLLAHGSNVVNVILVDYRGFDTLGEIAVLVLAALGVHSLILSSRKKKKETKEVSQ